VRVLPAVISSFVEKLFAAAGLSETDAKLCAETHVLQEMRGITTHGLRHVPLNLEGLSKGWMNARPNRIVVRDDLGTLVVDGDKGVGILGCMDLTTRSIAKAKQFGVGIGIVVHSNHFLSAAPYCLRATEAGMIGICFSNTWASMGYPGAFGRVIANSPTGFGVPSAADFPVIFDTSLTTSGGKLSQWIRQGSTIPPALLGMNKEGDQTADPAAVLHGGTPWPIGGHKGAGLAVLVEILTGLLGGSGFLHGVCAPELRTSSEQYESQCYIAIDIERFMPLTEFCERMAAFIRDLKGNPTASGYTEIFIPGERAHRTRLQSLREGVVLEPDVAAELRRWGEQLNVGSPY
jgi:LDH2 family malate/lactate/ureidoglycolate dehydrogenase